MNDLKSMAGFRCHQCDYSWSGKRLEERSQPHKTVKCPRCSTRNGEQKILAWEDGELNEAFIDWPYDE